MSQAFISDPDLMEKALEQASELNIYLPSYFHFHSIKFSFFHHVKVLEFGKMCDVFLPTDFRMKWILTEGKVDAHFRSDFFSGLVEGVAAKFLSRVSAQHVEGDDQTSEDTMLSVSRLRCFHRMIALNMCYEEIQTAAKFAHALLTPAVVDVTDLNMAMAKVISDKPGPMLKPFLAGGATTVLLSRAVDGLEKREAEKRIATLMTQVDVDLTLLDTGTAGPEVAVLFPHVHMLWIIHQDFGCT